MTLTMGWRKSNVKSTNRLISLLLAPSPQNVWGLDAKVIKGQGVYFTALRPTSKCLGVWKKSNLKSIEGLILPLLAPSPQNVLGLGAKVIKMPRGSFHGSSPHVKMFGGWRKSNLKSIEGLVSSLLAPLPQNVWGLAPK